MRRMKLRTTATNVQGPLSHAQAALTKAGKEAEELWKQGVDGSTSNAVEQADVSLKLETSAAHIKALTSERNAPRTTAVEAIEEVDQFKGDVTTVTAELNALKTQRSTLASQVTAL